MKLSEMKQILSEGQIQLTKSLGQNFLHDVHQLDRIVAAAEIQPGDHVLEIGPGLGPLTEKLLEAGAHVWAIEKDRRLFEFLQKKHRKESRLELVHGDALEFLRKNTTDWSSWKVVSNLPYSVASPILVELAQAPGAPISMVVTLQLEVAERIMAKAGDDHYGLLTLLLQVRYEPGGWFRISARCFWPVPEVDSACITLRKRSVPLLEASDLAAFQKIVKRAFSQRRKMMFKLLKSDWPIARLENAFQELSLPPTIRAEDVSLEQFVRLTRILEFSASTKTSAH
ncbi:MAG: 16S rRNA (adenine(1518)-N(6)/adenine(1519)-N(6))-dimethyltransferase RsmA [Verrucomicrobiota bacterium]